LAYISVAENLGICSTTFTKCVTKATKFGEITQNKKLWHVMAALLIIGVEKMARHSQQLQG